MLENVSPGIKLLIALGAGIVVYGVFRWLVHLVNKASREMNLGGKKNLSQKQILKNVMNAEYD